MIQIRRIGIRARACRVIVVVFAMMVLATNLAAGPTLHGGMYKAPKPRAKPPSSGASTAPGTAPTSAPGMSSQAGARSGSAKPGMGSGTGNTGAPPTLAPDMWELWWQDNQDRFLDLRAHLREDATSSNLRGPLTGDGRAETASTRRASDAAVERDILPVLFELLAQTDEPEILDSALIALGRCVPEDRAEQLLAVARPFLADETLSVQTSAVLALGIQGSPRGVPLLGALMADTSAGRMAVGGGSVPPPVQALAALSLGLGNHPAGVPMLVDLVQHLPDAERDLKACSLVALGLSRNEAGNDALLALLELLTDQRLDSLLKAQVPLSVATLDDGAHVEAVPTLVATLSDQDTDASVRVACLVALGHMASPADAGAIYMLEQAVARSSDERARHAAVIALAEIGRRDLPDQAAHATFHESLVKLLTDALAGAARAARAVGRRPRAAGFARGRAGAARGARAGRGPPGQRVRGPRPRAHRRPGRHRPAGADRPRRGAPAQHARPRLRRSRAAGRTWRTPLECPPEGNASG